MNSRQRVRAAVEHRLGRDDLDGVKIAVQGVGNVGQRLVEVLRWMALAAGLEPVILPHGEFAGALGALEIAASAAD